jgi:hypothetical protein
MWAIQGKENIIFEQVGLLAGSTSYIHVHVGISLSSIYSQVTRYQHMLDTNLGSFNRTREFILQQTNGTPVAEWVRVGGTGSLPTAMLQGWVNVANNHLRDVEDIYNHLNSIRNILPDTPSSSPRHIRFRNTEFATTTSAEQLQKDPNIILVHPLKGGTPLDVSRISTEQQPFHRRAARSVDDLQPDLEAYRRQRDILRWGDLEPNGRIDPTSLESQFHTFIRWNPFWEMNGTVINATLPHNLAKVVPRPKLLPPRNPFIPDIKYQYPWDAPIRVKRRTKRFAGLVALPLAVATTVMGLYNTAQLEMLKAELSDVKRNTMRLFEVVQDQSKAINSLYKEFDDFQKSIINLAYLDPTFLDTKLSRIENQLRYRIQKVNHAIQSALHRRLAIDYLLPEEIKEIFVNVRTRARELGCELLIHHHSDLFQIETSLLFDGEDGHLLLHVPMVPKNAILRLFKLHPFPLPIFSDHFIIPEVRDELLAISSTDTRVSLQLSSQDLLGCHRVNQVFMCSNFGVFSKKLSNSCMGSLYMQNFSVAKQFCKFSVHPLEEKIYQLKRNLFAAYLPHPITVSVKCNDGKVDELHLAKGVQKLTLNPGCEADFPDHRVTSDFSLKMETEMIMVEWDWEPLDFLPHAQIQTIVSSLKQLEQIGISRPLLEQIKYQASYGFNYASPSFVISIVILVAVSCLTSLFLFCCILKCKQHKKKSSYPPPVICANAPNPTSPASGPVHSGFLHSYLPGWLRREGRLYPSAHFDASSSEVRLDNYQGPRHHDLEAAQFSSRVLGEK